MLLSTRDRDCRQSSQQSLDRFGQYSHFIINNARCITVSDKGSLAVFFAVGDVPETERGFELSATSAPTIFLKMLNFSLL